MKKKFTFFLMSLFLVNAIVAAPTDLPQMTTDLENPVYYTISNTRSTSGKYLYYAGADVGLKDADTISLASLFYFTGTTDACYVHNAATTKKVESVTSWTDEGVEWAINVTPYGDGTTGLTIGPKDNPQGAYCWNEYYHNDGYTLYVANDAGSVFVIEPYGDELPDTLVTPELSDRVVTDLAAADPTKCYTITTMGGRGAWAVGTDGESFTCTRAEDFDVDATDVRQQFAILSLNAVDYYLYSVSARKFVKKDGSLVAGVADAIEFVDASSMEAGRVMVRFDEDHIINVSDVSRCVEINNWRTLDEGNAVLISEAGDFDATEALAMLSAPIAPDTTVTSTIISDLADSDPTKCYTITTNGRGAWAVDSEGAYFSTTTVEGCDADATDPRQQFAILSANGEDYYIYSVSAKKFVKSDRSLVAGVADAIEFVDASSYDANRVMVRFRDVADANINIGGAGQMTIDSWGIIDAGNAVLIAEAGEFDATEALAVLADPESADMNALIAQAEQLLATHASNHAAVPAIGQYATVAYEALQLSINDDSISKESVEAAIAVFEDSKCLPVFTIDGVYSYVVGMSIYEHEDELKWKATDIDDQSMLWAFDITGTTVSVADRVVVKNVATGKLFDNAFFVQVTETEENIADDGIFLIYPEGMGEPLHALSSGGFYRFSRYSVNSTCAWKFTYVGTTYGLNDLPVVPDSTITPEEPKSWYDVVVHAGENGTVEGGGNFEEGTRVSVSATPNAGFRFAGWSNGSNANPYEFTVREAVELTAEFEALPHPGEMLIPFGQFTHEPWPVKYFRADMDSEVTPGANWYAPDFDDSSWITAEAPITNVRYKFYTATFWEPLRSTYWVRRTFNLDSIPQNRDFVLYVSHDDECTMYLNGHQIFETRGWTETYKAVPMDSEFASYLVEGENVITAVVTNSGLNHACVDFGIYHIEKGEEVVQPKRSVMAYAGAYGRCVLNSHVIEANDSCTLSSAFEDGDTIRLVFEPLEGYKVVSMKRNGEEVTINNNVYEELAFEDVMFTDVTYEVVSTPSLSITISELSAADSTKCYTITTYGRGAWAVDSAGTRLSCTAAEGLDIDVTNPMQQFAILSVNAEDYYLYSVSAEKFVAKDGSLVAGVTDAIKFDDASSIAENHVLVSFRDYTDGYINIDDRVMQLVITSWNNLDDGNAVLIAEAGDFDATEALAMLSASVVPDTSQRETLQALLDRAKGYNAYSSTELGYYVEDFSYLLDAIAKADTLLFTDPSEAECEAMATELSQAVAQFEASDKAIHLPEPGKAYRIVSAFPGFYEQQSVEKAITINASDNKLWWGDFCADSLQQEFVFEPVLSDSGVHLSWNMDISLSNGTSVSETQYFYNLKNVATDLYVSYNDSAKYHLADQPCTVYLTGLGIGQFGLRFRVENEYGGGRIHTVHAGDHNDGVPSDSIGDYGGTFGISSGIVSWYAGLNSASAWYIRESSVQTDTVPSLELEEVYPDRAALYTRVDNLDFHFNKEVIVTLPEDGIIVRGLNTGEEFKVTESFVREDYYGGFNVYWYFKVEEDGDRWYADIATPDTYTYTIPAGVIKSVDGEEFPETTFTFTIVGTFPIVSYSPVETTRLETIELTFDKEIQTVQLQEYYMGIYDNKEYGYPVADISNAIIGDDKKTVTLVLNSAITTSGEYILFIPEAVFIGEDGMESEETELTFTIVEDTTLPGDVNSDGQYTMSDVVMMVNAVLEKEQSIFNAAVADMNGDGAITMSDVVGVLRLVLGDGSAMAPARNRSAVTAPVMSAGECAAMSDGRVVIPVALDNSEDYSAFQFDVVLPAGVKLAEAKLTGRAKAGHAVAWNTLADGSVRVVAYAMDNAAFRDNEGALLNLVLDTSDEQAADAVLTIEDALFTTARGAERCAADVNVMMRADETHIDAAYATAFRVYGAEGAVVVECGADAVVSIYAATGKLVQQTAAEAGKHVIALPAGVYVVNGNKVIVK